jgi:hypothetical protein
MPNYRIIGDDLKEYGPVSPEQIRQWIAEGRVNSETKLQAEGGGEWKRLSEVPEFLAQRPGQFRAEPDAMRKSERDEGLATESTGRPKPNPVRKPAAAQ